MSAVILATGLAGVAVMRSHVLPLAVLLLLGVAMGLMIGIDRGEPRDTVRYPALAVVVILVLVGIGQLGLMGLAAGAVLLTLAPTFFPKREHKP